MFSKIVQAVLKGIGIVSGFLPIFQTTQPSQANSTLALVTDDLTKIAAAVQTAGVAAAALTGAHSTTDVLKAAQPLVAQIIQQAEFVSGKGVKDETGFTAGVQSIISGMQQVLESVG